MNTQAPLAQLVEQPIYTGKVRSSSLLGRTINKKPVYPVFCFINIDTNYIAGAAGVDDVHSLQVFLCVKTSNTAESPTRM